VQYFPIKVDIPAFMSDREGECNSRMGFCHPVAKFVSSVLGIAVSPETGEIQTS
jgi:hypothetical protein